MKPLLLIVLFSIGIGLYSCTKQDAKPPKSQPNVTDSIYDMCFHGGVCNYYARSITYKGGIFSFDAYDFIDSGTRSQGEEELNMNVKVITTGRVFLSVSNNAETSGGGFGALGAPYSGRTDANDTGYVVFTQFDSINHLASGTFSFKTYAVPYSPYTGVMSIVTHGSFTKLTW